MTNKNPVALRRKHNRNKIIFLEHEAFRNAYPQFLSNIELLQKHMSGAEWREYKSLLESEYGVEL